MCTGWDGRQTTHGTFSHGCMWDGITAQMTGCVCFGVPIKGLGRKLDRRTFIILHRALALQYSRASCSLAYGTRQEFVLQSFIDIRRHEFIMHHHIKNQAQEVSELFRVQLSSLVPSTLPAAPNWKIHFVVFLPAERTCVAAQHIASRAADGGILSSATTKEVTRGPKTAALIRKSLNASSCPKKTTCPSERCVVPTPCPLHQEPQSRT